MSFRAAPDWDPADDIDPDICTACRLGQPGCSCSRAEDDIPDLPPGTLETPEARGWTPIPGWQEEEE
jgi:hypothetical protein